MFCLTFHGNLVRTIAATGSDDIISTVMEVSEVKIEDVIKTLTEQLKEHFKIKEAEQ